MVGISLAWPRDWVDKTRNSKWKVSYFATCGGIGEKQLLIHSASTQQSWYLLEHIYEHVVMYTQLISGDITLSMPATACNSNWTRNPLKSNCVFVDALTNSFLRCPSCILWKWHFQLINEHKLFTAAYVMHPYDSNIYQTYTRDQGLWIPDIYNAHEKYSGIANGRVHAEELYTHRVRMLLCIHLLIRDCTVGLKSWARYSRMQPCYICGKTGHKQTNCWFRNKKPGEKPCFRCGSNEHIVKNCSLPRQTNASLAMEENHSCFAQGDREHDENDWYTTSEERIRTLVMDAIHESLQRYGMSLPEGPSWEFPKPKVPKPQERLMFQDLMMLIFDDANTFLESPVPLPPRGQQIPGYCLNVGYWWWAVLLSTLHVTCRTTRIFRSYWISAFLLNWSWRPDMRLWLSLIIIRVPVPQSKYYNIVYKVDTQACL